MKNLLLLAVMLSSVLVFGQKKGAHCDPEKEKNFASLSKPNSAGGYGAVITKDKAVTLLEVEQMMKDKKVGEMPNVKVTGVVTGVCKAKGCWMGIDNSKGESVRVRFKDYAFFVPRNCEGQTVFAEGTARYDTTSVEMLQHYALDAGKPKAEIEKITAPKIELTFEATGVLFEKK